MMIKARLGRVWIGDGEPVRIMGVVNLSPESFYKGSVRTSVDDVVKTVDSMVKDGVDIIDLGGMSTAPYNRTLVSIDEELGRLAPVVKALKDAYPDLVLSIDTFRARVAEECLRLGADVINDVTGLKGDPDMAKVVADHGVSVIVMARERTPNRGLEPVDRVINALRESVDIALNSGIGRDRIVIDPGIGFGPLSLDPVITGGEPIRGEYRHGDENYPWYSWDSILIMNTVKIRQELGLPILIGVSRKSFLERLIRRRAPPEDRLFASISVEAISVLMGADAIRTHNVHESRDAVRVGEALRLCLNKSPKECSRELIKLVQGTA
jgi:dihydropteroate synthase